MSNLVFDLEQLYNKTFGSVPYKVPGVSFTDNLEDGYKLSRQNIQHLYDKAGNHLQTYVHGAEIWLPTKFRGLPVGETMFEDSTLLMPYTTVRITGSKLLTRTPILETGGTVKELIGIDDYKITIKGFLIDPKRIWPYYELKSLAKLIRMGRAFYLDNALTNVFLANDRLGEQDRVVITSFDFPEVEGGRKHIRPFSLQLESDSIDTLEWLG